MSLQCRPHMEPSGVPCIRPPMPPRQKRLRLPVMTVNGMEPDAKGNVVVDPPDLTELEERVSGLADAVDDESRRAVGAEEELGGSIAAEASRAKAAEQGLRDDVSSAQTAIADRYTKRETDEKIAAATPSDYDAVKGRVAAVEAKVPAQASAQNQLADKAFVNSSIATNTAFYISDGGRPFQSLADLENYEGALTNNDYAFVVGRDAAGNTTYTRYKWNEATEAWGEEYVLNNSSFTAEQWAAISSGITSGLVAKLGALPTAEALAAALAGMQARLVVQSGYAWRFSTESQGADIEAFMEDAGGYSVTSEAVDTGMRYSVAGYDTGLYLVPDTFVIGSPSSVQFLVYNASETELYGRVSASYEAVSEGIPPEVDPAPARGSGRLTTSGGVWSMIWGALTALPTGVASLYDWCVAQFAKYLPLMGGTMTGGLTVPNLTVGSRKGGSAVGEQSVAEGNNATASGLGSHAEGNNATASGYCSHAEGFGSTASGLGSHAEGSGSTASGNYSHAEGTGSTASGDYSHAEGVGSRTQNSGEHAQGRYNASHKASDIFSNAGNTLSSIGFGAVDNARKNAVETMQDGKTFVYGLGNYDGTNPSSAIDIAAVVNAKAERAPNPTAGNLAALDANGNPVDSGIAPSAKLNSGSAAQAWGSGTAYAANAIVTYNGVVYQNLTGSTIQSATTPDTIGSGWTVKPVSDLFLPLTGGTLTGSLTASMFEVPNGAAGGLRLHYADYNATIYYHGATGVAIAVKRGTNGIYYISFQDKGGTVAFTSDIPDVSGYAAKAANPTAGHLATLDAGGNPVDSGIAPSAKLDSTAAAPAFSTAATYDVGDRVTYNGALYRCTTAVTTAGAWNAADWTAVKLAVAASDPVVGNLAALDDGGNPTDAGYRFAVRNGVPCIIQTVAD